VLERLAELVERGVYESDFMAGGGIMGRFRMWDTELYCTQHMPLVGDIMCTLRCCGSISELLVSPRATVLRSPGC